MFQPVKIAPSILSANFLDLGADIALIERAGAAFVHIDVMDGHFVPNLTMGVPLLKQLKPATSLVCDVHLMIDNPLVELPWFIDAGADLLNVHVEALSEADLVRAIAQIHEAGLMAAAALKPKTPPSALAPVIADLDMALVMSVSRASRAKAIWPAPRPRWPRWPPWPGLPATRPCSSRWMAASAPLRRLWWRPPAPTCSCAAMPSSPRPTPPRPWRRCAMPPMRRAWPCWTPAPRRLEQLHPPGRSSYV